MLEEVLVDCHWINDFGDRKQATEFRSKLMTNGAERNVKSSHLH